MDCSPSTLASGLLATDWELTSALQVSMEVGQGLAQHQQQLPHQGPTTLVLPAVVAGSSATTQHGRSISASWIPLPTPPTLQAWAVTPCPGDQSNDLRKREWPCQHPPGTAVVLAESAVRRRTLVEPQLQKRPMGPTALPVPSVSNTSSSSKCTLESVSLLISSAGLKRAEEVLALTVHKGRATLIILAFILLMLGICITLFAGQARDQHRSPSQRPALPGSHSTNMGTGISLLPSQRDIVTDPLPHSSVTGKHSIGQPWPSPPDTNSSMPPPFRSQASNRKPLGSSSMPLHSPPGQSSVSPWQLTQTAVPSHSLEQRVQLCEPGQSSLSPWQLTQTALPSHSLQQRVQLCELGAAWSRINPYFTVSAEVLQSISDSKEATGTFDVWCGGGCKPEPLLKASVLPWGSSPRSLGIYAVGKRGQILASCAPSMVNSGSELQIRDQDGRIWGTLSARASNAYSVFQFHGQHVLDLFGNHDTGQLMVKIGEEVVAHAVHNGPKKEFEIGIRPQVDPVLMLVCVLAVLIFNPKEP